MDRQTLIPRVEPVLLPTDQTRPSLIHSQNNQIDTQIPVQAVMSTKLVDLIEVIYLHPRTRIDGMILERDVMLDKSHCSCGWRKQESQFKGQRLLHR